MSVFVSVLPHGGVREVGFLEAVIWLPGHKQDTRAFGTDLPLCNLLFFAHRHMSAECTTASVFLSRDQSVLHLGK